MAPSALAGMLTYPLISGRSVVGGGDHDRLPQRHTGEAAAPAPVPEAVWPLLPHERSEEWGQRRVLSQEGRRGSRCDVRRSSRRGDVNCEEKE